jgi:hypothetical protein
MHTQQDEARCCDAQLLGPHQAETNLVPRVAKRLVSRSALMVVVHGISIWCNSNNIGPYEEASRKFPEDDPETSVTVSLSPEDGTRSLSTS